MGWVLLWIAGCAVEAPLPAPPGPLRVVHPESLPFYAGEGEWRAVWEYQDLEGPHTVVVTIEREEREEHGDEDRFGFATIGIAVYDYLTADPPRLARPPISETLDCMTFHEGQDLGEGEAWFDVAEVGVLTDLDRDGRAEITVAYANRCWAGRGQLERSADPRRDRRTVLSWEGAEAWTVTGSLPVAAPGKPTEGRVIHQIAFTGAPLGLVERAVAVWAQASTADVENLPDESVVDAVRSGELRRLQPALDAHPGTIDERYGEERRTALREAAEGPLETVVWLLDHGADPDIADDHGDTPLHVAVERGAFDLVSLLLERGANADGEGGSRATPLQDVLRSRGDRRIALLLLERGASPKGRPSGKAPLEAAVETGDAEIVTALVARGVDTDLSTLVERALSAPAVLQVLVHHGANGALVDAEGRSLLERAARADQPDSVRVLLEAGVPAPVGVTDPAGLVAAFDAQRVLDDALMAAIAASDLEATVRALAGGASIEARRGGRTPLASAARTGNPAMVGTLLERGARVDVRDEAGRTPLHEAARTGSVPAVELLLAGGADATAVTRTGEPVVFDAARACSLDIVRRLATAGASLEVVVGFTNVLMIADDSRCDPTVFAALNAMIPP